LEDNDAGLGWVRQHAVSAVTNRERLAAALRTLSFQPLPSAANFVFVPDARADHLAREMCARGVQVRAFTGLPRDLPALRDSAGAGLRIGVGPWETMERVLTVLREVS
jgi:histidinol-phosphate/aromatic aminotransferase/cobyric acid decarboxylase-like protein